MQLLVKLPAISSEGQFFAQHIDCGAHIASQLEFIQIICVLPLKAGFLNFRTTGFGADNSLMWGAILWLAGCI